MSDQEKIDQAIAYAEEKAAIVARYPNNVPVSVWLTDLLFFSSQAGHSVSGRYPISHKDHHLLYLSCIAVRCKAWLEKLGAYKGWVPVKFEYSEKKEVFEQLERLGEEELSEEDCFLALSLGIGKLSEALYDEDEQEAREYLTIVALLALGWINRLLKRGEEK